MAQYYQSWSMIPQLTLNYDHALALTVNNQPLAAEASG
jgi:hypothetical protein